MQLHIISLFPEMFQALRYGIVGRALENQLLALHHWNPRDFTTDPHHTVDDRPYGGGPGMVMKVAPLRDAIRAAQAQFSVSPRCFIYHRRGGPSTMRISLSWPGGRP